jgi:helicase
MNAILNPAQQEVVEHGLLDSGFSCILQMPTGSGKTWLAALAIRKSLEAGHRAVYLSPLRALAEELATRWSLEFAGFEVGIFTGDYGSRGRDIPTPYNDSDLLIMTPERLDACTRHWRSHWSWIPKVDLVVVDEIHLLGDSHRGARLEGAISRLRRLNPFVRILGLSATLGNRGELADWLEGVEFGSSWRAVPLEWRIERFRKAQEKPDLLCREAAHTHRNGMQSLVFVQSRRRCESLAKHLRSQGIAADFHHAGLLHSKRRSIEEAFRRNETPVLVATGTLEMGLNLPARQVVLYDLQGYEDGGFCPLATNTVWQRAGRAGRQGLDSEGEVVLFASAWDKQADSYRNGKFERIVSGFRDRSAFEEQVLVEIQSGMGRTAPQLQRIFSTSLASRQRIPLPVEASIESMKEAGIVDLHPETFDYRVTPLGRVAIRQMLSPATVLKLRDFLESVPQPTFFDLLVGASCTIDCEPVLAVDFEELETLADSLATCRSRIFAKDAGIPHPAEGKRLLAALKTAAVLIDWTSRGDAEGIAEDFNCYAFEVVRLRESMDRIITAMDAIQRLLEKRPETDETQPTEKSEQLQRIDLLRQMVLNGLDTESASLSFVDGIGSAWARKLIGAGIPTLQKLSETEPHRLVSLGGVSSNRAEKWIQQAGDLKHSGTVSDAPADFISVRPSFPNLNLDPYRLRRAADLHTSREGTDQWVVRGGLEPHRVMISHKVGMGKTGNFLNAVLDLAQSSASEPTEIRMHLSCDCPDHAKGHVCKHILAIRLSQGDPEVVSAMETVREACSSNYLDLLQLWFSK